MFLDQEPGNLDLPDLCCIFDPSSRPLLSTHDSSLGLPIARRLVEEHAGTIVARNCEQGGLEVTITVPLAG